MTNHANVASPVLGQKRGSIGVVAVAHFFSHFFIMTLLCSRCSRTRSE